MNRYFRLISASLLLAVIVFKVMVVNGQDEPTFPVFLPIVFNVFDPQWQSFESIQVDLQPIPNSTPFLIIDSSGQPHLLWDTWAGNQAFIYHTYLTKEGWTPPDPISPTLGRSELLNPPVAGTQNSIYLVWFNQLNLSGPYRILYNSWNGSSWASEQELLGDGKSSQINGMVRLDRQGIPNVSFINSTGFFSSSLYYRRWTGNGFSPSQQINPPSYTSLIWLDSDSGLHFYGDDYNSRVRYSYWKNGKFIVNDRITPGKINSRRTILDGQNNLHLVRQASVPIPGGNVTGIYHQCLKNDSSWTEEKAVSGQNNTTAYRLSYNNLMQPILAWSEDANTKIKVTFWNGCNLSKEREVKLPVMPNSNGWGDFLDISENTLTGRVCFLSKEKYSPTVVWVTCNN